MSDALYSEDPFEVYRREVGKIPPLDAAEEARCMEHVQASDEMASAAQRRLVEANLYRVIVLAELYQNDRIHIFDLIEQESNGLLATVDELSKLADGPFWEFASGFVKRSLENSISRRAHRSE